MSMNFDDTKVSLGLQLLLNTATESMSLGEMAAAKKQLHFVKWLINKYPDTRARFDMDAEYEKYESWLYEVTHIELETPRI